MEDMNQALQPTTEHSSSPSPLERPSGDEDPAAMTIEFLRARLLSERSVSKAARQRAHLLAKKVAELEERLEVEIQFRKKLEADRLEILLQYRAELSEEYGDFFASNFEEGCPRDESAPDSPNSRKNDTSNQDEEGLPNSRLEPLDRSDSSQHLNCEDANDEDDETDHSGREKGVLSWGRRKGSRKDFGYGTDWLGRSLSQRSLMSTDGESPQKKWAGKSVRQIRKRENRRYETNFEGENRHTHAADGSDDKIGQPSDTREPLPCEDERDMEVERVLEQQAELIEQYEAEENAQRAWEAKYNEGKGGINHEDVISPSNSAGKLDAMTCSPSEEKEFITAKDDATKLVEKLTNVSNQFSNDSATRHSSKVHPVDLSSKLKETQEEQIQCEPHCNNPLQDSVATEAPGNSVVCSSVDQSRVGILEGLQIAAEKSTESTKTSEMSKEDLPNGQVSPNTDTEQSIEQSMQPTMDVAKRGRYNKHMSSSFRFAIFPDAEQATGSSPQMQGFATYKQDSCKGESWELNGSSAGASGQVSGSGFSDALHHDLHHNDVPTASSDHHTSGDHSSGDHAAVREHTESQEKGKDRSEGEILERENLLSRMDSENGVTYSPPNVNSSSNMEGGSAFKEDLHRGMKGLGGDQDIQSGIGRTLSDSSSHVEPKGPGSSKYLSRHHTEILSHPNYGLQPTRDVDGATYDNLALYPSYRSGVHGSLLHATAYEEVALRSNRRSLDGFDRVADVLRALQIAKLQIQCAKEEDAPGSDGNDDDGRDAFYGEPPRFPPLYAPRDALYAEAPRLEAPSLPPIYGAGPPPYATSVPYSSRGPTPYMHNMHGWSSSGYGIGLSRQVPTASYMHYPSRMSEAQNLWPPPPSSHGVYNGNMYHYDTRQHR